MKLLGFVIAVCCISATYAGFTESACNAGVKYVEKIKASENQDSICLWSNILQCFDQLNLCPDKFAPLLGDNACNPNGLDGNSKPDTNINTEKPEESGDAEFETNAFGSVDEDEENPFKDDAVNEDPFKEDTVKEDAPIELDDGVAPHVEYVPENPDNLGNSSPLTEASTQQDILPTENPIDKSRQHAKSKSRSQNKSKGHKKSKANNKKKGASSKRKAHSKSKKNHNNKSKTNHQSNNHKA